MSKKPLPFFVGRVFKHEAYAAIEQNTPEIKTYTSGFVDYWNNGFNPIIGKDGILSVPDVYSKNAIGRAHVEPLTKDPMTYSSTEECWSVWATTSADDPTIPTSNSFLIYCVADNRWCCLLSYLDQTDTNSHDQLKNPDFRIQIRSRAEEFYEKKKIFPMHKDDHDSIFSDKWINPE